MVRYSIIIPVYKVEQYLRQCVDSILSQTFKNYEVILVDDGSPDNSGKMCDEIATNDARVKVIHKQNAGLSSARNIGLEKAQGEYVLFLDSDDWWDDVNALEKIDAKLSVCKCDVLIFGMKKYFSQSGLFGDERPPKIPKEQANSFETLMKANIFTACAWNKVVRRTIIEENKLRFAVGQLSEDIEWCARLLLFNCSVDVLATCFYVYRQQREGSITATIKRKNVEDVLDTITRLSKSDISVPLKHYLANQLVLLMSFSHNVKANDIDDLMQKAKNFWWLTKYNWYPYVHLVSRVRFLGFDAVRFLLGMYHKHKRG